MNARDAIRLWNLAHPIGTPVLVRKEDGRLTETKTASFAFESQGVAVIRLERLIGACLLERVNLLVRGAELEPERVPLGDALELFAPVRFGQLQPFIAVTKRSR